MPIKAFVFLCFILFTQGIFAQNLLLNGDFEEVVPNNGNYEVYLDTFYAKKWFSPTYCSVDIYRDHKVCSSSNVMNIGYSLDFCVHCASGNYCIGFLPISYYNYMEHLTGKLSKPLEAGKTYKVSFAMKFFVPDNTIIASKGLGYKFNKDSVLFHADSLFSGKDLSPKSKKLNKNKILYGGKQPPYYTDLFATEKVYADFSFQEYMTDTTWNNYTTYYTAKGGERFITLGQFAYKNDKKIMEQIQQVTHRQSEDKLAKFANSNKCLYLQKISSASIENNHFINYYLMDNIKVEEVSGENTIPKINCSSYFEVAPINNQ